MDRFKLDVFVAKSVTISSSVDAILSFSANFANGTAGLLVIAGTELGWGDLGSNIQRLFSAIFAVGDLSVFVIISSSWMRYF